MSAENLTPREWERLWSVAGFMKQQARDGWERIEAWVAERRREAYTTARTAAEARATAGQFTDDDLIYAGHSRCPCGAGLAYHEHLTYWDCSDILTGRAAPAGSPGAKQHTDKLPFTFYEIKSERQPSVNGATTRPAPAC